MMTFAVIQSKKLTGGLRFISAKYRRSVLQAVVNRPQSVIGRLSLIVTLVMTMGISGQALAICQTVSALGVVGDSIHYANDMYAHGTNLPATINIESEEFQPLGTIIASTTLSMYVTNNISPETEIYRCDYEDRDQLYQAYATNGKATFGGNYASAASNALVSAAYGGGDGIFQSYVRNLALRFTNLETNEILDGMWKISKLNPNSLEVITDNQGKRKIRVKAKDFANLKLDLIRVGHNPNVWSGGSPTAACSANSGPTSAKATNCSVDASSDGRIVQSGTNAAGGSVSYPGRQASAYITLVGPGMNTEITPGSLVFDTKQSGKSDKTYAAGYGISNMLRVTREKSCIVRNVTPVVVFPTISRQSLENGNSLMAPVSVEIKCQAEAQLGINSFQTAMGIRVPVDAYNKAKELGLANGFGGVSHLLSTGYGWQSSIATGVGISFEHSDGRKITLLGNDGLEMARPNISTVPGATTDPSIYNPTGAAGGWFSVADGADMSDEIGGKVYRHQFTSRLERLSPSIPVTSGHIRATAYVVVQVQ